MGTFVFIIVILAIVGGYVWQFIESRFALSTTAVLTRYTPEQAAQIIDGSFGGARGVLWARTGGQGAINRRRRGYRGGITLSFDIEALPDGMTRVDMWVSQYVSIILLANFGGAAARRKRAVGRLLAEPDTQQLVGQMPAQGSQPAPPAGQPGSVADSQSLGQSNQQ